MASINSVPVTTNSVATNSNATPPRGDLESGDHPCAQAEIGTPARRTCASASKSVGAGMMVVGGAMLGFTIVVGTIASLTCPNGDVPCPNPFTDPLILTGMIGSGAAITGGAAAVVVGETVKIVGRYFQNKMNSTAQQQTPANPNAANLQAL